MMHIHLFNPNWQLWTQSRTEQSLHLFSYLYLQRSIVPHHKIFGSTFFPAQVKKKSFSRTSDGFIQILDYIFLKKPDILPKSKIT